MNRKLLRSVREYKRESFLTPVLVCLEVTAGQQKGTEQAT